MVYTSACSVKRRAAGFQSTMMMMFVICSMLRCKMENCAHPVCITKDLSLVIYSRDTTMMAARYDPANAAVHSPIC